MPVPILKQGEVLIASIQAALTDHDLITFSRRFGNLDFAPIQENGRRFVYPEPAP